MRPNPIAAALNNEVQPDRTEPSPSRTPVGVGTTDEIIPAHLTNGGLDWEHLAASIPAIETHRAGDFVDDPAAQAIVLADAGASADATASVLRAHGLDDDTIVTLLTVTVPDSLGARSTLYDRDEAVRATREPRLLKPQVDELVADLLLAAGRHPAAARHLAETSGQPASVINLMEERLRRSGATSPGMDRRANRGLALIDEWAGPGLDPTPSPASPTGLATPDPPEPPAA